MRRIAVLVFLALSACGADGAPERPGAEDERPPSGISVTGSASFGITSR